MTLKKLKTLSNEFNELSEQLHNVGQQFDSNFEKIESTVDTITVENIDDFDNFDIKSANAIDDDIIIIVNRAAKGVGILYKPNKLYEVLRLIKSSLHGDVSVVGTSLHTNMTGSEIASLFEMLSDPEFDISTLDADKVNNDSANYFRQLISSGGNNSDI